MRSNLLLPATLAVFSVAALSAQTPPESVVCDDNVCLVEANGGTEPVGEVFSVVCPLGQSVVEPIGQAPRLSTLDGKTIAVVGGSFMASVTIPKSSG